MKRLSLCKAIDKIEERLKKVVEQMEGILPLWKERGMTSHDCVFKLRKILKTKKVGHTGTLDPNVDGVLPICIGKATKVAEYLTNSGKSYIGEITIGFSTTTEDNSGDQVERKEVLEAPSIETVDKMMMELTGEIVQVPPLYSAVKVNGKRLYEYARAGESVERPERRAHIYRFKRVSPIRYDEKNRTASWRFEVDCGKGTYVRTLAVDLGRKLGYPAHMSDLTRVKSGRFNAADCLTLEQVSEKAADGNMEAALFPLEYALENMERIDISAQMWEKVKNGAVLSINDFMSGSSFPCVLFFQNQAVSIYDKHPSKEGLIKPTKVLRTQVEEQENEHY